MVTFETRVAGVYGGRWNHGGIFKGQSCLFRGLRDRDSIESRRVNVKIDASHCICYNLTQNLCLP